MIICSDIKTIKIIFNLEGGKAINILCQLTENFPDILLYTFVSPIDPHKKGQSQAFKCRVRNQKAAELHEK